MIYFTSDLHLGHNAIIELCKRPFSDIEEMNRILIKNINTRVKKNDTLYILGDFSFRAKVEEINELIPQINGKKILVRGNHDKDYDISLFEGIYDYFEFNFNRKRFVLMHYPILEWNKSRSGVIHLHGHQHNSGEYNLTERARRYDVGVDANNFFPVSLDEILENIRMREEKGLFD